ncbi:unnamed protein product [Rhizophagus irregularis]|nr:unnamed protein product [Rhizophagus irregularis]CAB4439603.1 unnamed protein product [Rhizophagus irregularis]
MSDSDTMATLISQQELDFFTTENPTPVKFFKRFSYTSKNSAISKRCSTLNACLTVRNSDPKLVELKRNYENYHYNKSINDYFLQLHPARVLEKEKVY